MSVKGVILCGGEGRRLRPLTYYFQKTMIPVGRRQKPLLEYIIKLFRYYGFDDLVLLVGYKYEQIQNYFEDGSRYDVRIEYIVDPPGLKGSGHALLNAYSQGVFDDSDNLLIYYGDILSNIDLKGLHELHVSRGAYATLAVATKYQVPVGVIKMDGDRVREMVEKPWIDMYATIGILEVSRGSLDILEEIGADKSSLDIMGDFIPALVNRDLFVTIFPYDGFWYDVGSTEKYEKLNNHIIDELFKDII
jgi:mannose-1-phosphate guanylyltransferase